MDSLTFEVWCSGTPSRYGVLPHHACVREGKSTEVSLNPIMLPASGCANLQKLQTGWFANIPESVLGLHNNTRDI